MPTQNQVFHLREIDSPTFAGLTVATATVSGAASVAGALTAPVQVKALGTPVVTAGFVTFDCTLHDDFSPATLAAGGPYALTFTGMVAGQTVRIGLKQDGTGSRVASWPAGTVSPGGSGGRVLSTTAGAEDAFTVRYDGTNYRVFTAGLALA